MQVMVLGTGHAGALDCYNTCFLLEDNGQYFLVDCGGGNGLIRQLRALQVNPFKIHDIFITHRHLDHITGILWVLRRTVSSPHSTGTLRIYGNSEVIHIIFENLKLLFTPVEQERGKERICFIPVQDKETKQVIGHEVTFFDIHSTKAFQFGFSMNAHGRKIVCLGDEPYNESESEYLNDAYFLFHEAFCMYRDAEVMKPYEKSHSTVKDAALCAEKYKIPYLLLYHAEESDLVHRKENYIREAQQYYHGTVYAPDDLDIIKIQE